MITFDRFSEYRVMWIMVFFDLPTETKLQVKAATEFRKKLLKDGFTMYQYSIYVRHCASRENAEVHTNRVKKILPQYGKISILVITDKQFGEIIQYTNKQPEQSTAPGQQLELF
ncbi:MAG: CRISPR-associated endonuclease Cas2 [Paludibacteraceae bacterium]|nr:CRISPR-associated endonuclease Cas2 [Paludibacteraceae bacterium]